MDDASDQSKLEYWVEYWLRGVEHRDRDAMVLADEKIAALNQRRKQQPGLNRMEPDSRLNRGAN